MKATGTSAPEIGSVIQGRSVKRRREAAPVLARERVVGAELGEERDHHPADQVAPIGIGPAPDRVLEAIERGRRSPVVPGGEGELEPGRLRVRRWQRRGGRGRPGPRRGSRRAAARAARARSRPRRGRAAGDRACAPRRVPGIQLERPCAASSSSSASASWSAGEGGDRRGRPRSEPAGSPGELGDHGAVAKRLHGGDPLDPEGGGQPGSRRRRPSPARPRRRACRSRPRAPGRAGGTARTSRPRSRRPRAAPASARPPGP